jgi:adenylate cyclase
MPGTSRSTSRLDEREAGSSRAPPRLPTAHGGRATFGIAAPLITAEFGGEVEKFIGDGVVAVLNGRDDQPNHAPRAAGAALALQQAFATLTERHPDWPGLRVGVNSGQVVLREIGGHGHVAYPMVGDTINTGSRLEALAPSAEFLSQVKGKDEAVDAYVLRACPSCVA